MNTGVQLFLQHSFWSQHTYPEVGLLINKLLDLFLVLFFIFDDSPIVLFNGYSTLYFPLQCTRVPFLPILDNLLPFFFLVKAILTGIRWYLTEILTYILFLLFIVHSSTYCFLGKFIKEIFLFRYHGCILRFILLCSLLVFIWFVNCFIFLVTLPPRWPGYHHLSQSFWIHLPMHVPSCVLMLTISEVPSWGCCSYF
jgi:hypothetical protein